MRLLTGMLTKSQLAQITASVLDGFGCKTDEHREELRNSDDLLYSGVPGLFPNQGDLELIETAYKKRKTPEEVAEAVAGFILRIQRLETELSTLEFSDTTHMLVERVVKQQNLPAEMPSPHWFDPNDDERFKEPPDDFLKACRAVVTGLVDAYKLEITRLQGRTDHALESGIQKRIEEGKHRPMLSELWGAYKAVKLARGKWNIKSAEGYERFYDDTVKVLGDRELADYSQDDALKLLAALKGNSAGTISGKIEFISSLFKFALKTPEAIDKWQVRGNPFTEMQVSDSGKPTRKVIPYTQVDLISIFTGLLDVRKLVEPHRFWVPLVALYSGMRQDEICQLRTEDIVEDGGVLVFNICHKPNLKQTTKSKKSRVCPVHPMLAKLGFGKLVEKQRLAKHDRLFHTLSWSEGKDWTGRIRTWWNETFQKKHVADTTAKSFHSMRHNFFDWYKQSGSYEAYSDKSVIKSMAGHADGDVTSVHYEEDYPSKTKLKMLAKLDYGIPAELVEALRRKEF